MTIKLTDEREMSPEEKTGLVQLEWFLRFGNAPNASELIDAYRAAVRTETLREVRGVVEGVYAFDYDAEYGMVAETDLMAKFGPRGDWLDRDALLAAIDALAQPEGME